MSSKKAGVFSPYLDTLGGGEKYVAGAMKVLVEQGFMVELWWKDAEIMGALKRRFGIDLNGVVVNPDGYTAIVAGSGWQKYKLQQPCDVVLWVSDGSIPVLAGKRNVLHFQVPFSGVLGSSWKNRLKLARVAAVVCNSAFTKTVIDSEYGVRSQVVYPPTSTIPSLKKERLILSVGRFDNLLHSKRQDILIQAFRALNAKGWKLVLAGGVHHGADNVVALKKTLGGVAVDIVTNPDWQTLERLYGSATCYWHAAGFGVDPVSHPEQMEHFGIATVEAMSGGAVPIVYAGGGQTEIVKNGENGYVFHTVDELVAKTTGIITDAELRERLSRNARADSSHFSMEAFTHAFAAIVG